MTKNFCDSFRESVETLHANAATAGIPMTAVCEEARVSRATPRRYLKRVPATISALTGMHAALDRLMAEKASA